MACLVMGSYRYADDVHGSHVKAHMSRRMALCMAHSPTRCIADRPVWCMAHIHAICTEGLIHRSPCTWMISGTARSDRISLECQHMPAWSNNMISQPAMHNDHGINIKPLHAHYIAHILRKYLTEKDRENNMDHRVGHRP